MQPTTRVLKRMADVAIALSVGDAFDCHLNKIQLQKFIYLLDVVGILYRYLPPAEGHETYLRGPYDPAIQNAVDVLAFRGFVKVTSLQHTRANLIRATYSLSDAGRAWHGRVVELRSARERWLAANELGEMIGRCGWDKLVSLVYAEPTFSSARGRGYGQRLSPDDGLSDSAASMVRLINFVVQPRKDGRPLHRKGILQILFGFLNNYASSVTAPVEVDS